MSKPPFNSLNHQLNIRISRGRTKVIERSRGLILWQLHLQLKSIGHNLRLFLLQITGHRQLLESNKKRLPIIGNIYNQKSRQITTEAIQKHKKANKRTSIKSPNKISEQKQTTKRPTIKETQVQTLKQTKTKNGGTVRAGQGRDNILKIKGEIPFD
jgi:NADH dehydrogenase/NADH:ubiquinone oxidoreductase subunit G